MTPMLPIPMCPVHNRRQKIALQIKASCRPRGGRNGQ
ncbi:hypothetical protein ANCCAN_19438 [Ancylostoma caninum]|uniref:Uncharacterized protein n=1 Tax=Ancylostoma caninum TaxID=29170 RepID=A0A368FVA5_ANCCA|nr:hypothetical protein ANCCAN_19438 [Ancylostoma caninum]